MIIINTEMICTVPLLKIIGVVIGCLVMSSDSTVALQVSKAGCYFILFTFHTAIAAFHSQQLHVSPEVAVQIQCPQEVMLLCVSSL